MKIKNSKMKTTNVVASGLSNIITSQKSYLISRFFLFKREKDVKLEFRTHLYIFAVFSNSIFHSKEELC